jgi:hypothetical protein
MIFLGTDERFPWLALAKATLPVHITGMELNLYHLHNDMIHVSGFDGDNVIELDAVSQADARLSHSSLVSYWFTLLLRQPMGTDELAYKFRAAPK